jgi:undecaprenyl diphosphate synthase
MSDTQSDKSPLMPRHIAIIMDGNGRWAKRKMLPRFAGHRSGVEAVRDVVKNCAAKGVEVLTLFAFSSENWRRPEKEVGLLMELLYTALSHEVKKLNKNNVKLSFIGDRSRFDEKLRSQLENGERMTADNTGLHLVVAVNYGGKWDITQATQKIAQRVKDGELAIEDISSETMDQELSLHGLPSPDLFIRTGGEKRISNFLLWQLAYTELYFTDVLWPDFNAAELDQAIASFCARERRFGQTSEQVKQCNHA